MIQTAAPEQKVQTSSASREAKQTLSAHTIADNSPDAMAQRKRRETLSAHAGQTMSFADSSPESSVQMMRKSVLQPVASPVQRSPHSWRTSPEMTRIRALPHGWGFSTWKRIKAKIANYIELNNELNNDNYEDRRIILGAINPLIQEWRDKPEHIASDEERVQNIERSLPSLERFIAREIDEIDILTNIPPAAGTLQIIIDRINLLPVGDRAEQIFAEINAFPFKYSGMGKTGIKGFEEGTGDCGTLARMYELVAGAVGIAANTVSSNIQMLQPASAIHGRTAQGNTLGIERWFFNNHTWVVANGNTYDMLFMQNNVVINAKVADDHYNGVAYQRYTNGEVTINAEDGEQLRRAFSSVDEFQRFVDQR